MGNKDFLAHLQKKKTASTNQVSMTIRVSPEEEAAIQDLAAYAETTRQEVIYELIATYLLPAWEKLREEDAEDTIEIESSTDDKPSFHLLNTNKANSIQDHSMMIEKKLAAAFENGWKQKINKIKAGDHVFLYESGKGIVAHGVASGEVVKAPHEGRPDETYYQQLHDFTLVDRPISPKDIRKALGRKITFVHTLTRLKDGDKLLATIE